MESIGDQILRIPLIEKDEIEEGSKVDQLINIYKIFDGKFKNLNNSSIKSCTIFKVNVWQRESNPDAYTPKMVSIGPYHNKNPQLHQMEKYKFLYLQQFLRRKEGVDMESCISELKKLREKAINCYEDVEDDGLFCTMLLCDGCFVVQFIRQCHGMFPEREDEIFNNNNIGYIVRDLMLLENQLPFFILDKLHDMTKRDYELPFTILVCEFLSGFVDLRQTINRSIRESTSEGNIKHLLHLLHILSCHGKPMEETHHYYDWYMVTPNATQLSEAGVKFVKHWDSKSIFDIEFDINNGSMSLPQFSVTDDTETLLRNFIAYEQQSVDVRPKYFSDFTIFMDKLIESDKDVTFLNRKGIIAMKMGTEKQVANLFNKIASEVTVSVDFYYNEVFRAAVEYCKNNRMRAVLVHYFLKNALTKASTVVAFIALIFTCIQTILAYTGPLRK